MSPATTPWLPALQTPPLRKMRVSVHLPNVAQRVEYEAVYRQRLDAYGDALERHPNCERVHVTELESAAEGMGHG